MSGDAGIERGLESRYSRVSAVIATSGGKPFRQITISENYLSCAPLNGIARDAFVQCLF
jgi:hypothetical protein